MAKRRAKIHLIDGSGYIFRAYYAIRPLSTSDGTPTQAVLGFAKMLHKLLRQEAPERVAIAFDTAEDNFRHAIYPRYKANRSEPPEDLVPQFALIFELVEAMGLPSMARVGFEADDLLATQARCAIEAGYDVVLISGDKDLMQLVGPHLTVFDPLKDQYFGQDEVKARFGVPPERITDYLALMGDTSDNVPGVPSVGPSKAAQLIERFGDVEAVVHGLQALHKRKAFEEAVVSHAEQARLSKRLVVLDAHVPMPFDAEALHYQGPHPQALAAFFTRIEARGLLRDFDLQPASEPQAKPGAAALFDANKTGVLDAAADAAKKSVVAPSPPLAERTPPKALGALHGTLSPTRPIERGAYRTILQQAQLDALLGEVHAKKLFSFDLETDSLNALQAQIVGISVCVPDGVAAYIPLWHHYLGVPKQLDQRQVIEQLAPLLQDPGIAKVGQHLKYDALVLRKYGVRMAPIAHDAMLAAYVLDPSRMGYGLDALAREYLGHTCLSYDDVTKTGRTRRPFADVSIEDATAYAAEDADVALRLCQVLVAELHRQDRLSIYQDIEIPLVPVLLAMEEAGVAIDAAHLQRLSHEFSQRLVALEKQAESMLNRRINLASPKQLAEVFFNELKLQPGRKTKTGYSTDQSVLESLAPQHPIADIVLQHRLLSKLQGTYVEALPRLRDAHTGRVHTSFQQTGTATGRLSSTDPNLQNIPVRGEDGVRIRAGIVAPKGHVLLCADYSQIELRIMAHLAHDETFIDAFKNGEDIHARTAREILTGGAAVDKEARRRAKAINFGILYGLSEFGLSRNLGIPRAEAQAIIGAYFGRYRRIRAFLDETIEQGRRLGYVQTLFGRRRPLPNLKSRNGSLRQAAERIAMNAPIQGSAADLMKIAMVRVQTDLQAQGAQSRLLLQVHDELVLQVPHDEVDAVGRMVSLHMQQAAHLAVPLVVDVGTGDNWAQAH